MSHQNLHPEAEALEALAEGTLGGGDRAVVESHVLGCAECQTAVEEWRSLFAALEGLPRLAPSTGFADRVMLRVRLPGQVPAWRAQALAQVAAASQRVGSWMPHTTRGWAMAVALLALPALLAAGLVTWLLTRSYLTADTLWTAALETVTHGAQRVGESLVQGVVQTDVMTWLVANLGEFLATAGMRGIGAAVAAVGALSMLSIYVLYRNLIRTPTRESHYVTYSF